VFGSFGGLALKGSECLFDFSSVWRLRFRKSSIEQIICDLSRETIAFSEEGDVSLREMVYHEIHLPSDSSPPCTEVNRTFRVLLRMAFLWQFREKNHRTRRIRLISS
jgi:hypothetical protein